MSNITVFWIDKKGVKYNKSDMSNSHLLNVIEYIAKGGGYLEFLTGNKINDIYDEAIMRGLTPKSPRSKLLNTYQDRVDELDYLFHKHIMDEIGNDMF